MNRLLVKLTLAWNLFRFLGPSWVFYRFVYAIKHRMGYWKRKLPATTWDTYELKNILSSSSLANPETYLDYRRSQASPRFFFDAQQREQYQSWFARWDTKGISPVSMSEKISHGIFYYFSHMPFSLGFPPDWHRNPITSQNIPSTLHWSKIDDFQYGDIKMIWEPNRFAFTYTLVRAYWRTGDERYAEVFWNLLEDWYTNNPPNQGANWKCGQEISIRVMALCFGFYGFLQANATNAYRVAILTKILAASGERIAANIDYALSQKNNHGISEGTGLWTIGVLFPELYNAHEWRSLGRKVLEDLSQTLIYPDGSFSQHSANYHRVMLHMYIWAMRLGVLCDQPFSAALYDRITNATTWIYQIQDEMSGRVPCYGSNDGALILPLSICDDQDYRPVIQSAYYLCHGNRCYHDGPWDEDLLWLYGADALHQPTTTPPRYNFQASYGGYYTLRDPSGFVFLRCATLFHRPSQADMLHLDLWWNGQNIALDAGTYSYNAPDPWNNTLAHTICHNTVTVDNTDQMERLSKFFWAPWIQSQVCKYKQFTQNTLAYWEGEHFGYIRLAQPVCYRRGVLQLGQGWWLVLDGLRSNALHKYQLHWLFPDVPYTWDSLHGNITLQTSAGLYYASMGVFNQPAKFSLAIAEETSPNGWRAPRYTSREPAISVTMETFSEEALFWTLFGPKPSSLTKHRESLSIDTIDWNATITTNLDIPHHPLLAAISATGLIKHYS